MGELSQSAVPAQHGSFLQQASVDGLKVPFAAESDFAVGTLSLSASGDASNFDFGIFTISFDYILNDITYPWSSILAWHYANFYIDNVGFGTEFLYRKGSSVSGTTPTLRKSMLIDIYPNMQDTGMDPSPSNHSHNIEYYCKNNDSSSHTITMISIWKYIVMGGPNG